MDAYTYAKLSGPRGKKVVINSLEDLECFHDDNVDINSEEEQIVASTPKSLTCKTFRCECKHLHMPEFSRRLNRGRINVSILSFSFVNNSVIPTLWMPRVYAKYVHI